MAFVSYRLNEWYDDGQMRVSSFPMKNRPVRAVSDWLCGSRAQKAKKPEQLVWVRLLDLLLAEGREKVHVGFTKS